MCGVKSKMLDKYTKLLRLGKLLRRLGKPDIELTSEILKSGDRAIENAVRACTLLELVLRSMDIDKIQNERWFYRPVTAVLLGHGGYFKKGSKQEPLTELGLKEEEAEVEVEVEVEEEVEEEAEEEVEEEVKEEKKPKRLLRRALIEEEEGEGEEEAPKKKLVRVPAKKLLRRASPL